MILSKDAAYGNYKQHFKNALILFFICTNNLIVTEHYCSIKKIRCYKINVIVQQEMLKMFVASLFVMQNLSDGF